MFRVNLYSFPRTLFRDRSRILILAASISVMTMAFGLPAQAATITVNSTADALVTNGQCTLREAIINAIVACGPQ